MSPPTGALVVRVDVNGQPFMEAKWRRGGRQVKRSDRPGLARPGPGRRLGPASRPGSGRLVRLQAGDGADGGLIAEHEEGEAAVERDERDRREHGATVRELAAEWLRYVEHEKRSEPGRSGTTGYYLSGRGESTSGARARARG